MSCIDHVLLVLLLLLSLIFFRRVQCVWGNYFITELGAVHTRTLCCLGLLIAKKKRQEKIKGIANIFQIP